MLTMHLLSILLLVCGCCLSTPLAAAASPGGSLSPALLSRTLSVQLAASDNQGPTGATIGAVVTDSAWVFTANPNYVYAMCTNFTNAPNSDPCSQFSDAVPLTLQLLVSGETDVYAIAEQEIILYRTYLEYSSMYVQRVANVTITPFSYQRTVKALVHSNMLFVVSTTPDNVVALNALSAESLMLLWNQTLPSFNLDNGPAVVQASDDSRFVYVLSGSAVLRFWLRTGAPASEPVGFVGNPCALTVVSNQFAVMNRSTVAIFATSNNSLLFTMSPIESDSTLSCSAPILVNGTWLIGSTTGALYAYDSTTFEPKAWSPLSLSGVNSYYPWWISSTEAEVIIVTNTQVWQLDVASTQGAAPLQANLSNVLYNFGSCELLGGSFSAGSGVGTTAFLSYQCSQQQLPSFGLTLVLDMVQGVVQSLATGNFQPVGSPVFDPVSQQLLSSSVEGSPLQGFPVTTYNSDSDVLPKSFITNTMPSHYPTGIAMGPTFALNTSSLQSYLFTESTLYVVDVYGTATPVANFSSTIQQVLFQPIVTGSWIVAVASSGSVSMVLRYDVASSSLLEVNLGCTPSLSTAPFFAPIPSSSTANSVSLSSLFYVPCAMTNPNDAPVAMLLNLEMSSPVNVEIFPAAGIGASQALFAATSEFYAVVSFGSLTLWNASDYMNPIPQWTLTSIDVFGAPMFSMDGQFVYVIGENLLSGNFGAFQVDVLTGNQISLIGALPMANYTFLLAPPNAPGSIR
jgi:hypothetical protein